MSLLRAQEQRVRVIEQNMSDDEEEDEDADEDEQPVVMTARSTSPQLQPPAEGGLWMRRTSSAAKIKRQYESAVRSRKTSTTFPVLVVSEYDVGDEAVQQLMENGHSGCEEEDMEERIEK
jgi:hypothetical protein